MPKLSLDINGSQQQNAGPWCFNYSLFRGYASKELQKHNFPVRIVFCRLLQCFYLKLFDLYLQKSSVHLSAFSYIYSPIKCFTGSQGSGGWKAALQSVSSKTLLSTGSARAGSGTVSSWVLSISRDGDSTAPLSNLFQRPTTLALKVASHISVECPALQFVPISFCPFSVHHWAEPASIVSTPSHEVFITRW